VRDHVQSTGLVEPVAGDRPWTPVQVFAATFLFGPFAGGLVAGINFSRLGRAFLLVPSLIFGAFLFAMVILVGFAVPTAPRQIFLLVNLAIGGVFLLMQKASFEEWKKEHWTPRSGEEYRANRIGLLFLVGLGGLAVEVGVIFLLVYAGVGG
jgi:hypothetical protein